MTTKAAWLPSFIALAFVAACGGGGGSSVGDESSVVFASKEDPGVYCEVVEQRVTRENCEDLTRADQEVRPGAAAFNVPDPMNRGDTRQVHLVVDRRSPEIIRVIEAPADSPDLNMTAGETATNGAAGDPEINSVTADTGEAKSTASVGDPAPTPGQIVDRLEGTPERFFPPVGRHMRAELAGEGFEIVAKSPLSREIPLGGSATWIWDVTAKKGGVQSLTLVTVVEGVAGGRHFVLASRPRVRTVTVEVTMKDRAWDLLSGAPPWIKALTALLLAIGGLIAAWRKLPWPGRRAPAQASPDDAVAEGGE